jgi:hypothetical protein
MTTLISDFLSKECKKNNHALCHRQWSGLGFQVICDCKCHNREEKQQALAWVEEPLANAKVNDLPFRGSPK